MSKLPLMASWAGCDILGWNKGDPRWGKLTRSTSCVRYCDHPADARRNPLVELYFTRLPKNETTSKHPTSALALANNGWIWAAEPLKNFSEYPSKAYLRRQVIVWGDCVKLRYGAGPEDNPWLWQHMISYAEQLAGIFDGFRLDNCHSTPMQVGIAIIDAGRRVNPNLYIMAELFTGSQEMDLKFVRELGINSLVREAYNGDNVKNFADL